MTDAEKLKRIAAVLKKHFTNLDVMKTIDIASEIHQAIEEELQK